MPRTPATSVGLTRPVGAAAGSLALVGAWAAAYFVARMTGAVAVTLVLAALVVGAAGSLVAGWWRLHRGSTVTVQAPPQATSGDAVTLSVEMGRPRGQGSVHVTVWDRGARVASGWTSGGIFRGEATFDRRGVIEHLEVRVRSGGAPGLVWWERRHLVPVAGLVIAPRPTGPGAHIELVGDGGGTGATEGRSGFGHEDFDGVRPWRDGDNERSVHWPSSLRTRSLVVHDHHSSAPQRWIVRSNPAAVDRDDEAGRCRWALDEARRCGARVWAAIGDDEPIEIADAHRAARWAAGCVPPTDAGQAARVSQRPAEPETTLTPSARWWTAGATMVATTMLARALETPVAMIALVIVGTAVAAALTAHLLRAGRAVPQQWHTMLALASFAALAAIMLRPGGTASLLEMLRGPLPQLLVLLVVVYGFECSDRRTARANLAISVVVACYASGIRVDGGLGAWLAVWFVCLMIATTSIARPTGAPRAQAHRFSRAAPFGPLHHAWRRVAGLAAIGAGGVAMTVLVLAFVVIPAGPAGLTLPAFVDDVRAVARPGGLVAANGTPSQPGDVGDGSRGGTSTAGRWRLPGVRRVARHVDPRAVGGRRRHAGPGTSSPTSGGARPSPTSTAVSGTRTPIRAGRVPALPSTCRPPTAISSSRSRAIGTQQFVQTYFVEVDQPNIVFAAYATDRRHLRRHGVAPTRRCAADRRRADRRAPCTPSCPNASSSPTASLRAQGDVADRVDRVGRAGDGTWRCPTTTTDRTRALAAQLAAPGASTYDTVLRDARTGWRRTSQYDLDAPVPAEGRRRRRRLPVRVAARFLRADRFGARRADAAPAGCAGAAGDRLRARRARPDVGRVEGPRQRRPRVGRGVVPRERLAGLRPHRRRAARRRARPRRRWAPTWSAASTDAVGDHGPLTIVCGRASARLLALWRNGRVRGPHGAGVAVGGVLQDRWQRAALAPRLRHELLEPRARRRWATADTADGRRGRAAWPRRSTASPSTPTGSTTTRPTRGAAAWGDRLGV